jgi:hypothetical protein
MVLQDCLRQTFRVIGAPARCPAKNYSILPLDLNEIAVECRTPGTSLEGAPWTDNRQGSPEPPSRGRTAAVVLSVLGLGALQNHTLGRIHA